MQFQSLKELIKVNLIYSNPQVVDKQRNKEAKTGNPSKIPPYLSVLLQNSFLFFIFLILYGFMFYSINFAQYPGMFTTFTTLFLAMSLLQGFYVVYNLFYESKDLIYYLPLPFKGSDVFLAKLSVLALMLLPYLVPILGLLVMLGQDAGIFLPLSFLISLPLFGLISLAAFFFSVLLVHLITKLSVFKKNKQLVTTLLYSAASFGMIGIIFFLSYVNPIAEEPGQVIPDMSVVPFIDVFYNLFIYPLQLSSWFGLLFWLVLVVVLGFTVIKWIVPDFYSEEEVQATKSWSIKTKKRKRSVKKTETINPILWKYNFSLIQDGTLIMQRISSAIVFPIFFLGPLILNDLSLGQLSLRYWSLFFFGGFVYAFFTLNAISIIGVLISLDRENFLYLKSLPFSLKQYLKQKFIFGYLIETILPVLTAVLLILIAKLPLLLGLVFIAGIFIGLFVLSLFYFYRDYRLLDLEWQNLTELFTRGGGNFVQVISMLGSISIGFFLIVLIAILLSSLSPAWQLVLSIVVAAIPIGFAISAAIYYKKKFWSRLES